MTIAAAACTHHPIRTFAMFDTVEFREALGRRSRARRGAGPEMAWAVFLGDLLSQDVAEDMERFAARTSPPVSLQDWQTMLHGTHGTWAASGQVIWDMSWALGEARGIHGADDLPVDDVLDPTSAVYVHFGAGGPPSPWPDCVVEGCYLDPTLCEDGVNATFVTSVPPALPLGEAPLAMSLACHVRSCDVILLSGGTFAQSTADSVSDVADFHSEWLPFFGEAVRTLGACLAYACSPARVVEEDFSFDAPRHLVGSLEFGSEAESDDAWSRLASSGFLPMRFFGRRLPLPGWDDGPGL